MEKTKHTPGPWQYDRNVAKNYFPIYNGGNLIAEINVEKKLEGISHEEKQMAEANAKLIAAAPELLEALRFCQSVIKSQGMFDASERMAFAKAENSIKKATE